MTDMQKKIFFFFIFKQIFEHAHNTSHVDIPALFSLSAGLTWIGRFICEKKNYRNRQKYSYMIYYVYKNKL